MVKNLNKNLKILGGIVTYNPDILRLQENVTNLIDQVDYLYVFDNNSENFNEIREFFSKYSERIYIYHSNINLGIAKALAEMMEFAKNRQFDWVLTADQDSVLDNSLVQEYLAAIKKYGKNDIGILTCLIKDRNFADPTVERQLDSIENVPICITAGAFMNVQNYFLTKGYDSELFIDLVDTDICFTLREKGFRILRINYLGLYQEIGKGENKQFLWKKIIVHHSSVFREYYMVRNMFFLHKRHTNLYNKRDLVKGLLLNLMIIVFYENNKGMRLAKFVQGVKDGFLLGRLQEIT